MNWLIWSFEHKGWWAPNRNGYTKEIAKAGRYGWEEAMTIVESANKHLRDEDTPEETMCPDYYKPNK